MAPIIPRNQGGSDAISNLQALCFGDVQYSYGHCEAGCVFCALEGSGRVLLENALALCSPDNYPMAPGHWLVIPRQHVADDRAQPVGLIEASEELRRFGRLITLNPKKT